MCKVSQRNGCPSWEEGGGVFEGIWVCEVCVVCARESVCNNERECVSKGEIARGPFPLVFCTPPRREGAPAPPGRATPNWAWWPQYRSKSQAPLARPLFRAWRERRGLPPGEEPPGRLRLQHLFFPSPTPSSRGRTDRGCRPSWAPSCSGCCCFCSGAAAAAAGARCRSRRRGCGSAGNSTVWEPSAGPVCAIELLIHRKKGGREKKEVTCPGYTYAKRSSRRREKLRRAGGGGREAAAEAAAAREAAAAAAGLGTDTHLYECACGF